MNRLYRCSETRLSLNGAHWAQGEILIELDNFSAQINYRALLSSPARAEIFDVEKSRLCAVGVAIRSDRHTHD